MSRKQKGGEPKPPRTKKHEKEAKPEKHEKAEIAVKHEKAAKPVKHEEAEIAVKHEKAAKPAKHEKAEKALKREKAAKPAKHEKTEKAVKKEKTSRRKRKLKISSALYLAPSFIGVMMFFILPFLVVMYYSVVDSPLNGSFVFLDNFKNVISNLAFRRAVRNTAVFSLVAVPLAVVLSLLLAMVLEAKLPFRSQFRTFFLSPMMVPVASIVLIWQVLFHHNGAINDFLGRFGVEKIDWFKSNYALVVIVILFLWKNLGYNMILFMAALASIPKDILEVATLESATPLQTFFHIKIRYLSSTLLFVTIMSLINSFKVFREVYLLTGNYPFDSIYTLQHFMNNKFSSLNYQDLSAAAILMSLVMIVVIGILFIVENHFGKDVEG